MDVLVELSPSLSPPSLSDSASKDATDSTLIDPSRSRPTDLVDPEETMSLKSERMSI